MCQKGGVAKEGGPRLPKRGQARLIDDLQSLGRSIFGISDGVSYSTSGYPLLMFPLFAATFFVGSPRSPLEPPACCSPRLSVFVDRK